MAKNRRFETDEEGLCDISVYFFNWFTVLILIMEFLSRSTVIFEWSSVSVTYFFVICESGGRFDLRQLFILVIRVIVFC